MPLDFPQNPTVGQIYFSWVWDGVKWVPVASGGWADAPSDGQTYGRRNLAWNSVDALIAPSFDNTGRNLLHNGLFNVQQRGQGPWSVNASYTADRWQLITGGNDAVTLQIAGAAAGGYAGDEAQEFYLAATVTGSSNVGSYSGFQQIVEGVARTAGKSVTVSFYCGIAGAATANVGIHLAQNFGAGGSPDVNLPSQAVTVGVNWSRASATFAVPSVAGQTIGPNGDDGLYVQFYISDSGGSGAGVQSLTFGLWGIQLEIGSVATPLEKRDPEQELALCQRFYQTGGGTSAGGTGNATAIYVPQTFPVLMRAAPTSTQTLTGGYGYTPGGASNSDPSSIMIGANGTSGTYLFDFTWTASADL